MSLLDELPHRCTIARTVRERLPNGGSKDTYPPRHVNVECWEQQAGASETAEFQQRGQRITHKFYFTTDWAVTENDVLIVTMRNKVAVPVERQVRLEVRSGVAPDASAGLGILYRVMAEQLTPTLR